MSTATYKEFGDPVPHPPHTPARTLEDIEQVCLATNPDDLEAFLKILEELGAF